MNDRRTTSEELARLLSAWADDSITDEEFGRLDDLLRDDPHARRDYMQFVDMHEELGELSVPGFESVVSSSSITERSDRASREVRYGVYLAIIAATVLLMLSGQWLANRLSNSKLPGTEVTAQPTTPAEFVATLRRAIDCKWREAPSGMREGIRLTTGELHLESGTAEITFDGGARMTIEGPTQLELTSRVAAELKNGKTVFRSDTGGVFELTTPQAELIDIGTEYAVSVASDSEEVHVFDGEVRRVPSNKEHYRLLRGEAKRYLAMGPVIGKTIDLAEDQFGPIRHLPEPTRHEANATGVLVHEGFAYGDPLAFLGRMANGGVGWQGSWRGGVRDANREFLEIPLFSNSGDLLPTLPDRPGLLQYPNVVNAPETGLHRTMSNSIELATDGIYYFSFRFQFDQLPVSDEPTLAEGTNAFLFILRSSKVARDPSSELRIGIHSQARELSMLFGGETQRTATPIQAGQTYLLAGKLVCNQNLPDQVLLRVFGPDETPASREPISWTLKSDEVHSDVALDTMTLHINSRRYRQRIDELRIGTGWRAAVATD